jgi:hypothetical protein
LITHGYEWKAKIINSSLASTFSGLRRRAITCPGLELAAEERDGKVSTMSYKNLIDSAERIVL